MSAPTERSSDESKKGGGNNPNVVEDPGLQRDNVMYEHAYRHFPADMSMFRTNAGAVVDNDNASLKSSAFGPVLLADQVLREKITHFDHERIPDRIVHARGFSCHGYFERNQNVDLSAISDSTIFTLPKGERISTYIRWSTVAGPVGSGDLARDVRGFAVRFYTSEGNWDLVGNNIPVFFINDAMKFPDLVHSVKAEPSRGFPTAGSAHDTLYDFIGNHPEGSHTLLHVMTGRGIPQQYGNTNGHSVNTYRLIKNIWNNNNQQQQQQQQDNNNNQILQPSHIRTTNIKIFFKPQQGQSCVSWDNAQLINGKNQDYHRQNLQEHLDQPDQSGGILKWDVCIQLLPAEDILLDKYNINMLDATKLIPEELFPSYNIGTVTFNLNVTNDFSENEQVAFCPQNLVPGIDIHHGDPLMQGRLFSYQDTQITRVGVNFHQIPINQPHGVTKAAMSSGGCPFLKGLITNKGAICPMMNKSGGNNDNDEKEEHQLPKNCPMLKNSLEYNMIQYNFEKDGMMNTKIQGSNVMYEPNAMQRNLLHGGIDRYNNGMLYYNELLKSQDHNISKLFSFNNNNTNIHERIAGDSKHMQNILNEQKQRSLQPGKFLSNQIFSVHNTYPSISLLDQWLGAKYNEYSSTSHNNNNNCSGTVILLHNRGLSLQKELSNTHNQNIFNNNQQQQQQQQQQTLYSKSIHPLFKNYFQATKATWFSLTPYEKCQIISAWSFELNQCQIEYVKENFVYNILCNIDLHLAHIIAKNIGLIDINKNKPTLDKQRILATFQYFNQHLIKYDKHFLFQSSSSNNNNNNNNKQYITNYILNNIFYTLLSMSPSLSLYFNAKKYYNEEVNIFNETKGNFKELIKKRLLLLLDSSTTLDGIGDSFYDPFFAQIKTFNYYYPEVCSELLSALSTTTSTTMSRYRTESTTSLTFYKRYGQNPVLKQWIDEHINLVESLNHLVTITPPNTSQQTIIDYFPLGQGQYQPNNSIQKKLLIIINQFVNEDLLLKLLNKLNNQYEFIIDITFGCEKNLLQQNCNKISKLLFTNNNKDNNDDSKKKTMNDDDNDNNSDNTSRNYYKKPITFVPLSNITSINYVGIIIPQINMSLSVDPQVEPYALNKPDGMIITPLTTIAGCPIINKILTECYLHGKIIIDLSTIITDELLLKPYLYKGRIPTILNIIALKQQYIDNWECLLKNKTMNTKNQIDNPLCLCCNNNNNTHTSSINMKSTTTKTADIHNNIEFLSPHDSLCVKNGIIVYHENFNEILFDKELDILFKQNWIDHIPARQPEVATQWWKLFGQTDF